MSIRWVRLAVQCCGRPIFFYSGLYIALGLRFILGSLYLDPDIGAIGLILLLVGVSILLLFFVLAYQRIRGWGNRNDTL